MRSEAILDNLMPSLGQFYACDHREDIKLNTRRGTALLGENSKYDYTSFLCRSSWPLYIWVLFIQTGF